MNGGQKYVYENPDKYKSFSIKKSVYFEDELWLYTEGIDEKYKVTCYDDSFGRIDEKYETEYKNGIYKIYGDRISEINGLSFSDYNIINVRYLKSDQYVALVESFVDDIGWMPSEGYENEYYTQSELNKREELAKAYAIKQQENFDTFMGKWINPDDENMYLDFFGGEDEGWSLEWQHADGKGDYIIENIRIDEINIVQRFDTEALEIMEGITWGCKYEFDISDDYNTLTNYNGDSYVRVVSSF